MTRRRWVFLVACLAPVAVASAARGAVTINVQVSKSSVTIGESITMEVSVEGASGGVGEPDLNLPGGFEVLASARGQNFSWINGRSSSTLTFQYEIAPSQAGKFKLGPVRVKVGGQSYESEAVDVEVTAAPRQLSGSTSGAASLVAEVTPANPYVGQPVVLRVRLILHATLAEDPQYTAPATTGFWAERVSDPESYFAQQGGERVLVTETRQRLYPLAPGTVTIGEASASLVLADESSPFSIFGGARHMQVARSAPVSVNVQALPSGAPASFDGAVGTLTPGWTADRASGPQDVPVTVRLDVRGAGNLPLLHTPSLDLPDFEIFGSTLEDSLPAPGSAGGGRRRFQWTLLPRHSGTLAIRAPNFCWFDPEARAYRTLRAPALTLVVGPPVGSNASSGDESFPGVFLRNPADPGASPGRPWGLGLAGLLLGGALLLWRRSIPSAGDAASQAQQREWLRAIGLAHGPEFWDAADRAATWLEREGRPAGSLPREVSAARYSGVSTDESRIRRRLVELLSSTLERGAARQGPRWAAAALALAALALAVWAVPHGGDDRDRLRAQQADELAKQGDLDGARSAWLELWRSHHAASLAARLAWVEIRRGRVGEAAAWVVRGDAGTPRDPALRFVAERVREAGGLSGERATPVPIRPLEWGVMSGLLALLALTAWPRRAWMLAGLLLSVALAAGPWIGRALDGGAERAVLLRTATLEGSDVELEPGQVVRVIAKQPASFVVRVGALQGTLPADALASGTAAP